MAKIGWPDRVINRLHSARGVKASANLYSLIETDKANGLEPYVYLRRVFGDLPKADSVAAIEAQPSGNIVMNQINRN